MHAESTGFRLGSEVEGRFNRLPKHGKEWSWLEGMNECSTAMEACE